MFHSLRANALTKANRMKTIAPPKPKLMSKPIYRVPVKDNREGRLHEIKTDRGEFRFKDNRSGE